MNNFFVRPKTEKQIKDSEFLNGMFCGIMISTFILIFGAFSGMLFHVSTTINTIIFLIALVLDMIGGAILMLKIWSP